MPTWDFCLNEQSVAILFGIEVRWTKLKLPLGLMPLKYGIGKPDKKILADCFKPR